MSIPEIVDGTIMRSAKSFGLTWIPSEIMLGVFNLVLGYAVLQNGVTRFGQLMETWGVPQSPVTYTIGILLFCWGFWTLVVRPRAPFAFAVASFLLVTYNILTAGAVLYLGEPGSGAIVSIFTGLLIWQNYEYSISHEPKNVALDQLLQDKAALEAEIERLRAAQGTADGA